MAKDDRQASAGRPPFRLLILADFCGDRSSTTSAPLPIDKQTFNTVMAELSPRAAFKVVDHLGGGKTPIEVDLSFHTMNDFYPTAILSAVEPFRAAYQVFLAATAMARGEKNVADVVKELRAQHVPEPAIVTFEQEMTGEDVHPGKTADPVHPSTGDILSSVVMPGGESDRKADAVSALIEDLGIPRHDIAKAPQRAAAARLIESLGPRLTRQLDEVLHHPDLAALEAAWRGLQLLVSRTDFQNATIEISMAPTHRKNLVETLHQVLLEPNVPDSDGRFDAALVDFAFSHVEEDLSVLHDLGKTGADAYCPIVAGASLRLLGVHDDADCSQLPRTFRDHFGKPEFIPWRSFRESEIAAYAALVLPRFAARPLYGPKTIPVPQIAYREEERPLWCSGIWIVGVAMVQSVVKTGWPLSIAGQDQGRVEQLTAVPIRRGSTVTHACAEIVWTDEQITELARAGFAVLSARPAQSHVSLVSAPTLHEPPSGADAAETREARLHATLPYRLLGNAIARRLDQAQAGLSPGMSDDQIAAVLQERLASLFDKPGCVEVQVEPPEEKGESPLVGVHIRPNFTILGQQPELTLAFELRS